MERLDAHVGAMNRSLQQRPEVLAAVSVNLPVDVRFGVIDDAVNVAVGQILVGAQRVGVDRRAPGHMREDVRLYVPLLPALNDMSLHRAVPVLSVAIEQSHDSDLSDRSAPLDDALAARSVHVASLPADEGLVNLDLSCR